METQTKKRRRRLSPSEQQKLVTEWRASGLSAGAFGEQVGVNKSNLARWARATEEGFENLGRRRRRANSVRPSSFVELRMDRDAGRSSTPSATIERVPMIEVYGPLGVAVRVYAGVDAETLTRVLAVLQGATRC
jgi:transposase-like protein